MFNNVKISIKMFDMVLVPIVGIFLFAPSER